MINKIFKKISNLITRKNYNTERSITKILKFIFFIRYLIFIFFTTITIYLLTPKFIKHEKNIDFFTNNLSLKYDLNLSEYEKIEYKIFPTPRLYLKNLNIIHKDKIFEGNIESLIIFLNFKNLLNYQNSKTKKILIKNAQLNSQVKDLKNLFNYIYSLDNNVIFQETNLKFKNLENDLITIQKIDLNKKDNGDFNINGLIFKKKILLKFQKKNNNKNKLSIKIPTIGINSFLLFDAGSDLSSSKGSFALNLLNTDLFFNFDFNDNLTISNSFVKNKNIHTSFDGKNNLNPYFNFNLYLKIKNANFEQILKNKINYKIINNKRYLKKFNGEVQFSYKKNKFSKSPIKNFFVDLNFENGDIFIKDSNLLINGGNFSFNGLLKNFQDFSRLNFNLSLKLNDQKLFLRTFDVSIKNKYKIDKIDLKGSINLSTFRINLEKVLINNSKSLNKKEILNYKMRFEEEVLQNSLSNLFYKEKISNFLEVFN